MTLNLDWINNKIDRLNDVLLYELFAEEEGMTTSRNLFLTVGGFLRAYGASLSGKEQDELDDEIEPVFDIIDEHIKSVPLLVYFLGSKLLNLGLVMESSQEDDDDLQDVIRTIK